MDDASLEEFVDASDEDERSESSESASGEERPASGDADDAGSERDEADPNQDSERAGEDDADRPAEVTPAASTYAWTGEGAVCGSCGDSTDRRWRDGDDLVCADCKEW